MELRSRILKEVNQKLGPVIYWMNRDQRVDDNWALLEAQAKALEFNQPLLVVFCVLDSFLTAKNLVDDKAYQFMKQGLLVVRDKLHDLNIPFILKIGKPEKIIPELIANTNASYLYVDFNPLKEMQELRTKVKDKINITMIEVDAHNVCPAFYITNKQEWGAYTLRPKINKSLDKYLVEFPKVKKQKDYELNIKSDDFKFLGENNKVVDYAKKALDEFLTSRLAKYQQRNDPNADATSRLSAYLHFGQLSAARVALEVKKTNLNVDSFLEELIVRKELADNYVLYNPNYDNFNGLPDWAKKTLIKHLDDKRDYLYSLEEFEKGKTHDPLWNAAQMQMVKTGYMHGYVRMYWAKKILEWTKDPHQALEYGLYLNNKYELDGRDPNGYVGVMWAIGGVHDRPWQERKVFGMIRFMNDKGMNRKFDTKAYINKWL